MPASTPQRKTTLESVPRRFDDEKIPTYQEKRLHLILPLPLPTCIHHIQNRRVPAPRNLTPPLNALEDLPPNLPIPHIASQSERDEERFDGFRPEDVPRVVRR